MQNNSPSTVFWNDSIVVDENRLKSAGVDVDLAKASEELLGPVRKALGRAEPSSK
jgi:hypothetical protein